MQRPNAREDVTRDLALLTATAGRVPYLRPLIDAVCANLGGELCYAREAANAAAFARALDAAQLHASVQTPRVVSALSTPRVLVTEWLEGASPSAFLGPKPNRPVLRRVASLAVEATLGLLLSDERLIHGDPHPGNLLVMPGGGVCGKGKGKGKGGSSSWRPQDVRLAFLDFGVLCRVPKEQADALVEVRE